jgi:ABC-2 type transport system permease protein
MKKYFEVAKITFKAQLAYRFDVIFGALLSLFRILLAFILWSVIFKGKDEIAGFTFGMMITYYILISFFRRLDLAEQIVWQMQEEIREGQFTKYLVRPVKPLWFFVWASFAKSAFVLGINLLATFLYAAIFHRYFTFHANFSVCFSAFLICLFGLNFLILLNYFIGVLSFKFIEVTAFNILKGVILEFLTGALIPLAILPIWLQDGMRIFPFYYIYYYPTMLVLNREIDKIPEASLLLIGWNVLMFLIVSTAYKSLRRKYEGVGV